MQYQVQLSRHIALIVDASTIWLTPAGMENSFVRCQRCNKIGYNRDEN